MKPLSRISIGTLFLHLSIFAAFLAGNLQAQPLLGDRVRASLGSERYPYEVVGTLVGLTPDSLKIEAHSGTMLLARTGLRSMEVSRGRRSHGRLGALVGGVGGGLAFGSVFAYQIATCDQSAGTFACLGPDPYSAFLLGAVMGGLVGAGTGWVVGHFVRTDRWEQV